MAAIVGALRAVLSLESAAFQKGLTDAQKSLYQFDKRMKAIGGKLQAVGAAVSVAGAGIAATLRANINHADEMSKAAQKFGVPTEQLSRLKYAADLSDVAFESLGQSLGRLSRQMVNAPDQFAALGVAVRTADGQMRGADAVLADLADVFGKMPDGAEKTALAIRLFGKSGADMIPLLNGGSDALRELGQEADAVGATVSERTGRAAEQFNDTLTRLGAAIRGFTMKITEAALPTLQKLADMLVGATRWFADLTPEMQQFIAKLALIAVAAGPAIVGLGLVVSSLGSVTAALMGLAALAVANPIGAAIAAIAAGAALIYLKWDGIKAFFVGIWTAASEAARAAWDAYVQTWDASVAYFHGLLDRIRQAFVEMWEGIKALTVQWVEDFVNFGREIVEGLKRGIQERWEALIAWFNGKIEGFKTTFTDLLGIESPSKVFRRYGNYITEGLAIGIGEGVPQVDAAMDGLAATVGEAGLRSEAESTRDAFKDMFRSIVDGSASAQEALSSLLASFAERLFSSGFDSLWSALFPSANGNVFSAGRPMAFANGGVVSAPTAFRMPSGLGLMGEAGPEAIMPLTRIGGKLGVMAAGAGAGVQVHYNIDARGASKGVDEMIAEALTRETPRIVRQSVAATQEFRARRGRS